MGKSLRASSRKSAKTKLRNTVHAPVEEARLQRLSTRLLALAASANPISDAMEVEHEGKFSPSYSASTAKRHILKSKKSIAQHNSALVSSLSAHHPISLHDAEPDTSDQLDSSPTNSQLATSTETNTSAQVQDSISKSTTSATATTTATTSSTTAKKHRKSRSSKAILFPRSGGKKTKGRGITKNKSSKK